MAWWMVLGLAFGAEETVTVPCPFVAGATQRYRVDKITAQDEGEAHSTRHERYDMSLSVASREGSTAVVEVRYDDTELLQADDPKYAKIVEAGNAQDLVLVLNVDLDATELAVANMDEMVAGYGVIADVVVQIMKENPAIPEHIIAQAHAMMVDPGIIENSLTGELKPLFQYTCGELSRAPVDYQAALHNPFGKAPLPATGKITFEEQGGLLWLHVVEDIDQQRARALMEPMLKRLGLEIADDTEAGFDDPTLDLSTRMDVSIDPASGWVTTWHSVSTTRVGAATGTEEISMKALD